MASCWGVSPKVFIIPQPSFPLPGPAESPGCPGRAMPTLTPRPRWACLLLKRQICCSHGAGWGTPGPGVRVGAPQFPRWDSLRPLTPNQPWQTALAHLCFAEVMLHDKRDEKSSFQRPLFIAPAYLLSQRALELPASPQGLLKPTNPHYSLNKTPNKHKLSSGWPKTISLVRLDKLRSETMLGPPLEQDPSAAAIKTL